MKLKLDSSIGTVLFTSTETSEVLFRSCKTLNYLEGTGLTFFFLFMSIYSFAPLNYSFRIRKKITCS